MIHILIISARIENCDDDLPGPAGKNPAQRGDRTRTNRGTQTITRHGAERAVVISIEDYHALIAHKPDFKAHLLGGRKVDDFSIERDRDTGERDRDTGRSVEL
jgi:prevent-host-death family protein